MNHERVAALHDGRLGPHERDELLNDILANEDEYELFAETAAVLREIEEARASAPPAGAASAAPPARAADEDDGVIPLASRRPQSVAATEAETDAISDRDDGVIPLAPRRPGRARWMAYGALAAGLAGLALAAALLSNRGSGRLDDPTDAVAMLEGGPADGVAPGLSELWRSGTRGSEVRHVPWEKLAVKTGAYLVDLELANASRDTAALRDFSDRIVTLLNDTSIALAGTSALRAIYHKLGSQAATGEDEVEQLLAEGRQAIRELMDPEWLELGIWAETARTAALRRDARFFRSRDSRAALERIATLPGIGEPLAAVRAVLPADGRIDWPPNDRRWTTLAERLTSLLREAGR